MPYIRILALLVFSLLLCSCNSYEKENRRLSDEIKVAHEENEYLKAQIVGLKRELDELSAKVQLEREALQRKFEEDRMEMEMRLREEYEAMAKKLAEAPKKNGTGKKEAGENKINHAGKEPKDPASKMNHARQPKAASSL